MKNQCKIWKSVKIYVELGNFTSFMHFFTDFYIHEKVESQFWWLCYLKAWFDLIPFGHWCLHHDGRDVRKIPKSPSNRRWKSCWGHIFSQLRFPESFGSKHFLWWKLWSKHSSALCKQIWYAQITTVSIYTVRLSVKKKNFSTIFC